MLFASEPSKTQAVVFLQRRLSSEWRAEVFKDIAKPGGIAGRCLLQAKAPHLQGDEPRRPELTIARLDIHQIHQRQITPKFFVTADAFVVGQKVTAAVEKELALVNLHPFHVMRGMRVHERDTFVDQTVSERDLFPRNFVAPIAAPVDRGNEQIAELLVLAHLIRDSYGSGFGKILEQIHSGTKTCCTPLLRNPAAGRSEREKKEPSLRR